MQNTQVMAYFLLPPHQHAPKAMHPTMGAFSHPPPCLETSLLLERLGCFAPRTAGGGQAQRGPQLPHLVLVRALGQPPPLGSVVSGLGPLDSDARAGRARQLDIIAIGPIDCEADGPPAAVGEHAALRAQCAAVGRMLAHRFPPQEGRWSWRHPWRAMPRPYLVWHPRPRGPALFP